MDGVGASRILFNSVVIRSWEIILIRSLYLPMAWRVSSSIVKPSWVANRIARIIRRGSSENVFPGSIGVFRIFSDK